MQADLGALLQTQQISNYLSLANNTQVPKNIRNQALNRAMEMMGLEKSNENDLPNDLIR